jgi:hypothetical protein
MAIAIDWGRYAEVIAYDHSRHDRPRSRGGAEMSARSRSGSGGVTVISAAHVLRATTD